MTQTPIKPENTENFINTFDQETNNFSRELKQDYQKLTAKKTQNKYQQKSTSLRQQLLQTVLPTVLIPLVLASFFGYRNVQEKEETRITKLLRDEVLLTGEVASAILENSWQLPQTLAKNYVIVDAAIQAGLQSETEGLNQLPKEELEKQFARTKLRADNQVLNDYLTNYLENTKFTEIFFTDKNGFNIAYSNPTSDFVQSDENWWKKAQEQGQFLELSSFDESSQTYGLELSQKIIDPKSGEFLGVIKALLPTSSFNLISSYLEHAGLQSSQTLQLIEPLTKSVFNTISTDENRLNKKAIMGGNVVLEIANSLIQAIENPGVNLTELANSWQNKYALTLKLEPYQHDTKEIAIIGFLSYENRQYAISTIPNTNWVAISSIKESEIQEAGTELFGVFALIGVVLGIVSIGVVLLLSKHLSEPLSELTATANQIAAGDLTVVAKADGIAETENLAETFNNLITKVTELLEQQEEYSQQTRLLAEITEIRALDEQTLNQSFRDVLRKCRQFLKVDRLVIYRFNQDFSGYISSEAVGENWVSALSTSFCDPCIPPELIAAYQNGRVLANNNVFEAGFHPEHVALMDRLQVKANLIVSILHKGELFGLLIAHYCAKTHQWTAAESDFLEQLAGQIGVTINRVNSFKREQLAEQEQRQEKELLQKRALELLMEVDPVRYGDLTIRASVKADEIGTIADSYNSTIESLRKIVLKVKTSALQVGLTTGTNDSLIQNLATEAQRQVLEINDARLRIQAMDESMGKVALNALQAEAAAQQATLTVKAGDEAMNRTVEGILNVRNTVEETAAKVRKLGQASEKISEVVSLISRFAAQTHLLALKASIEAARAGEEGVGFAVIADEVRDLAAQSSQATDQIELIVNEIQSETTQVVESMESGTRQVEESTKLVAETRQNLNEINEATTLINDLVAAIASATIEQGQDSEIVSQTIAEVAEIAQMSSQNALNVSQSFRQLLAVAGELQETVSQFKVN